MYSGGIERGELLQAEEVVFHSHYYGIVRLTLRCHNRKVVRHEQKRMENQVAYKIAAYAPTAVCDEVGVELVILLFAQLYIAVIEVLCKLNKLVQRIAHRLSDKHDSVRVKLQ